MIGLLAVRTCYRAPGGDYIVASRLTGFMSAERVATRLTGLCQQTGLDGKKNGKYVRKYTSLRSSSFEKGLRCIFCSSDCDKRSKKLENLDCERKRRLVCGVCGMLGL